MKVIYKSETEQIEKEYPNKDISQPVMGLDSTIQYYYIEVENIENPNHDKYGIIQLPDELTNKTHSEYSHLLICKRKYELRIKNQDEIIEKLNIELGNYLDENYLIPLRDKHSRELIILFSKSELIKVEIERKNYCLALNNWLTECRNIRDQRENDYLNQNIFPEFNNYPQKPQKT